MKQTWLAVWFLLALVKTTWAVNPNEVLSDPVLEQRARELSVEIRCLVCQNQSIDDSDAELAKDLRVLVRELLVEGKTNQEILDYLVERYGEFVLLKPRFGTHTLVLWAIPLVALLIGCGLLFRHARKSKQELVPAEPLSGNEREELDKILKG
jgi:cytochrome c-type biogenesis protein CcmH